MNILSLIQLLSKYLSIAKTLGPEAVSAVAVLATDVQIFIKKLAGFGMLTAEETKAALEAAGAVLDAANKAVAGADAPKEV